MSLTSGSFTPLVTPITPDLSKEQEGFIYTILAGAGVAGVVNPGQPQQGFVAYNVSNNWIRGTTTFTAGLTTAGAAPQRVFLVPPGGTFSADFSTSGATNAVAGAIPAVDSVSFVPVDAPAAAGVVEVSTLTVSAAATAGYVSVNFLTA